MGKEMYRREKRMMRSLSGTKIISGERKSILSIKILTKCSDRPVYSRIQWGSLGKSMFLGKGGKEGEMPFETSVKEERGEI